MDGLGQTIGALQTLRQARRQLLDIAFPQGDGPAATALQLTRLTGHESLSRDFSFRVDVQAVGMPLQAADVLGRLVTVTLHRQAAPARHFSGHVLACRRLRHDGGSERWQLELGPWLALLRQRIDSRRFHGLTLRELTAATLAAWPAADWCCLAGDDGPAPAECCQFDESDHNHLHRRWEARGWHYRWEHRADGHRLQLHDDSRMAPPIEGGPQVAWRGEGGPAAAGPGLWRLEPVRRLGSQAGSVASYDFKRPRPLHVRSGTPLPPQAQDGWTRMPAHWQATAFGCRDEEDARRWLGLRRDELACQALQFEAEGDDDRFEPGRFFVPDEGPDGPLWPGVDGDPAILVVAVTHEIHNNAPDASLGTARCRMRMHGVPRMQRWRPGVGFHSERTRMPPAQTARVIGPPGELVHVDALGRVKLRFHWERAPEGDAPAAGAARTAAPMPTPMTGESSWVRVATPSAGDGIGLQALPRVGQEVLVQWLDGDPDRPVVVGRLHNATHPTPDFEQAGHLPANRTQSGWSSRQWHGTALQQLQFDDSPGGCGVRLSSDQADSALALGAITTARRDGQAERRGEGAELRTDAALALRGGRGVLLEAGELPALGQLERRSMLDLVASLQSLVGSLSSQVSALAHGAADADGLQALAERLRQWSDGAAPQGAAGGAPALALHGQAGVAALASGSLLLGAQQQLDVASIGALQLHAGRGLRQHAADGMALVAERGGLQAAAGQGDLRLEAHDGHLVLRASGRIELVAGDSIRLQAPVVEIVGQGSGTQWGSGCIVERAQAVVVKADRFAHDGGDAPDPPDLSLPRSGLRFDQQVSLRWAGTDEPMAGQRYRIRTEDGAEFEGVTDAQGLSQRFPLSTPYGRYEVEPLFDDPSAADAVAG